MVTVSEGDIGPLHIGFKGTTNALYLDDLAQKTRRGLRGRIEAGRSGGGISYGYRVVRVIEGQPREEREVDLEEASIVLRIFLAFASGVHQKQSPRG
jgi:DNA invertase Pin-like site-specific DNA recombinase